MTSLLHATDWRHYRQHLILAQRKRFFGRSRYQVWDRGTLVGTFPNVVSAELHIDARLAARAPG